MYEPIEIPAFDTQFEDIHVYIHKLWIVEIEEFDLDFFPKVSPYTSIHHRLEVNGFPSQKDLVGDLDVVFRNQGRDQSLALSLDIGIRVRSNGPTPAADTFCKTVQFLFDWTTDWIKENDIRDKYNEPFVMPIFLYSRAHFEDAFPQ